MQVGRAASSAAILASTAQVASAEDGPNALGVVLTLMDDLTAKVTKDGEVAEKEYHEYFQWCDDTTQNAGFAIKTATEDKKQFEAKIAELSSEVENADAKIEELAALVATGDKQLKDAKVIRDKEKGDFDASEKTLMETVDALTRAVDILSRALAKNPGSFAQVDTKNTKDILQALSVVLDAASFSSMDQKRLVAFVQAGQDDDDSELGAPAAAVYESKAGGIVDVCNDMKEKAEGQLSDVRKAEVKNAHNFKMLQQSIEGELGNASGDLDSEKAGKATAEEDKATAEKDLDVTVKELKATQDQLATARSSCLTTAADHEASVAARKEELGVIATAKKIIQESTGGAAASSFVQVVQTGRIPGADVVIAVRRLATQQKSAVLAQLANNIKGLIRHKGRGDVFGKVKDLINQMIAKLEKEAGEDAEEKAWCDEQMSKTAAKKGDLEDGIEKMSARIDAAVAKSGKLEEELTVLAGELGALAKEQAELDNIRGEEHATYKTAKADLEQGLTGIRKALDVLQEYYGGASLLQEDDEQPAKPQSAKKSAGAGGSIIQILETVESDFATNLAKVEAEEADAQGDYDKVTQENKVTVAAKKADVKYKTQESKTLGKTAAEYKNDRKGANAELSSINEYFGKVKDRCIAKPETYEDRVARRSAEIKGLKEAMNILENEAALLQKSRRGSNLRGVLSTE